MKLKILSKVVRCNEKEYGKLSLDIYNLRQIQKGKFNFSPMKFILEDEQQKKSKKKQEVKKTTT